jgi:hypothetical protein
MKQVEPIFHDFAAQKEIQEITSGTGKRNGVIVQQEVPC